ncbi:hypothetical protein LDENG_00081110 [Lucifuga dentata]|nr:hypothetical protein LDENG_00081110 [Lucifuga dentata]
MDAGLVFQVLPPLPSVVYMGAAVLAGGFACFLPETLNIPLPDTIQDVEEKRSRKQPVKQLGKEGVALKVGVALQDLKESEVSGLNAL